MSLTKTDATGLVCGMPEHIVSATCFHMEVVQKRLLWSILAEFEVSAYIC